ncbi:MAG: hypothetical protein H0X16_01240 [Chloroflexi bacterium]|nr:hypothetical protein [Chloroflexota bacterium]
MALMRVVAICAVAVLAAGCLGNDAEGDLAAPSGEANGSPGASTIGGATTSGTAAPTASITPRPTLRPIPLGDGPFRSPQKRMTGEVLAFVNYGDLNTVLPMLEYETLSTIAYFSVSLLRSGRLDKRGPAWAGWTGSTMDKLIERAHRKGTRVVLTAERFAWSSAGATEARALLGSATARRTAAREIAAAVDERGVDGVNIDFEPIPSGQSENFVTFVRLVRKALDAKRRGYQLTYSATGHIANYDVASLARKGAADAVYIMGYQYRGAWSKEAGSVAPLGGPGYDVTDTVDEYLERTTAGKVILGAPLYGWSWLTTGPGLHARTRGGSAAVFYRDAVKMAGRTKPGYDKVEQVAWISYRSGSNWRQLYYDDARGIRAKFSLVKQRQLAGVGLWALGFEGSEGPAIFDLLRDSFVQK